ncbi:hypothetical protein HDU88_001490 [Geranomyces variabilis]|nr:hypothetical protein HDU88_001490 [Geranomyces variabilis]
MLEATDGSVNARAPFTFNFPPGNKPDQVISSFPTTFDSVLLTSVLTTAFGDLAFSALPVQPASTGAARAARAKKSRSRNDARSHKPTLSKAVSKPKISLIAVDPRPQPALPVELVDKILGYISSITDQFRVAVALGDLPRRDRLVSLAFPQAVYPMDAATEAGDIDRLDAWLSRHLRKVAASKGQLSCKWYSSAVISLAMSAKDPPAVLRWWARSKLPLDKCIAAVMAEFPSVQQLELVKACLPAPNKETLRDIMDMPSMCGDTSTLEWLKTSGWAIGWTSAAMDCSKSINAVKWWINSGLEIKYTEKLLDRASQSGNIEMLETWRTCGLTPRYSTEAMDCPKNSQVLEWWKSSAHEKSGWELRYTELSMDLFSGLYLFSNFNVNEERKERSLDVLSWWRASGLLLKYSAAAIHPSMAENIARWGKESLIARWWQESLLPSKRQECSQDGH